MAFKEKRNYKIDLVTFSLLLQFLVLYISILKSDVDLEKKIYNQPVREKNDIFFLTIPLNIVFIQLHN